MYYVLGILYFILGFLLVFGIGSFVMRKRFIDFYENEEDLRNILRTIPWDIRIIGEEYMNKHFTGKKEFNIPSKKVYYNYRQHTFSSSELRERITCKDK